MKEWLKENASALGRSAIAAAAIAGISYGAALERDSLGFIVPGAIVLGLMLLGRFFG